MEIKQRATPNVTPDERKKIVEVTAIPTAIWLVLNTHLKLAANPAPTITDKQHAKTPWAETWRENQLRLPDKQGRHVGT